MVVHPLRDHPIALGRSGLSHPALNIRDFVDIEKSLHLLARSPMPVPELQTVDFTTLIRSWPMFLNDAEGDCTCAGGAHGKQVFCALVGEPFTVVDADVQTMYQASGYVPGEPSTDKGWTLEAAAQYMMTKGLQGTPDIVAYAEVAIGDADAQQVAMELFGGLYEGASLPLSAQSQYKAGQIWTPTNNGRDAGSWGGHCMWRPKAVVRAVTTHVTWGGLQTSTWRWDLAYIDELMVFVPVEWETKMPESIVSAGIVDFAKLQSLVGQFTK